MPPTPSNSTIADEEDDDLSPPQPVQDNEPDLQIAEAPVRQTIPVGMDSPDLASRTAVNKIRLGVQPTDREFGRIAERQRLEAGGGTTQGGEGMDAPDRAVRVAALKAQVGARPSTNEIRRISDRQRLEEQNGVPPDRSISKLLEGSALDPRGTRQEQAQEKRRQEIERRRAEQAQAKADRNAANSATLAQFKASGQRYYTDPASGLIAPVRDESGRNLFHATEWEDGGEHPVTGEATLVKRDQFGQRQYKAPPIVASPDLHDPMLYFKFGDTDLRPAGEIEALKNHANPRLAKLAKQADRQRRAAMWREVLGPMEAVKADAEATYAMAEQRKLDLEAQMETLNQQLATAPNPKVQQQVQALALEHGSLDDKLKITGELGRLRRTADLDLKIFTAKARHESYTDLADERREILREQGKPEAGDPTLESILTAQATYGQALSRATSVAAQEAVAARKLMAPPTAAGAHHVLPQQTPGGAAPFTKLAQSAVSGLGGIAKGAEAVSFDMPPIDEAGRYFNAEAGAEWERRMALPASEQMKAIQSGAAYEFGSALQEAAREVYRVTPEQEQNFWTKAGGMAGGFIPLLASGPAAPLTIGLQTAGDELENIYQERIRQGTPPEAAAEFAIRRSLVSGGVQGLIFELLPKPLRATADKVLLDKIGRNVLARFLAGRVAQAGEGAVLGATSHGAANVAADRPAGEGVAEAATGLGLMQAIMPRPGGRAREEPPASPAPEARPLEPTPAPEAPRPEVTPATPSEKVYATAEEAMAELRPNLTPEQKIAEAEFQKRLNGETPATEAPPPEAAAMEAARPDQIAGPGEQRPVADAPAQPTSPEPPVSKTEITPKELPQGAPEPASTVTTPPSPRENSLDIAPERQSEPGAGQISQPVELRPGSEPVAEATSEYTRSGGKYFVRQQGSPEAFEVGSITDVREKYAQSGVKTGADILDGEGRRVGIIAKNGRIRMLDTRETAPEKAPAPVSAHITESTPETVEGPKISKAWTAFAPDSGTLGIPRAEMPQVKSEARGALVNFLKARGVTAKAAMVRPSTLKPTQAEFSAAKVEAARQHTGPDRPILVSSDGHVVDGHHQWVAGLDDPSTPMPVIRLNAPIDRVLAEMKEFPSTETAKGATKPAATKPTESTPLLSDRALKALDDLKVHKPGKLYAATPLSLAWDGAIELAKLGVRAGRPIEQVVRLAIDRFKARYDKHTPEDIGKLESDIRTALQPEVATVQKKMTQPGTDTSRVPPSLREVGTPAQDITYEVRNQNARMAEARAMISKDGEAAAERAIADRDLPPDTRVAIGGVLLERKMQAIRSAAPEQVADLSRDIQRITEATQSNISTPSGQAIAQHRKIYENLAVDSAVEYVRAATKERDTKLGGEDAQNAAQDAAKVAQEAKTPEDIPKAIEKLKKKHATKPARRVLDAFEKQIEKVREMKRIGALTRDDVMDLAAKEIGIPGADPAKLRRIAEIADRIEKAPNHAERSRAELELAETLAIFKGTSPIDLGSSVLAANILSGYTTQGANLQGNFLQMASMLGTTAAVNPGKLAPILKGLTDGLPLGATEAWSILRTGRATRDFQDKTGGAGNALNLVDFARDFPALGKVAGNTMTLGARAVEKVFRVMKATDAAFYYPAREAYARLVATKLLEGEYKGTELADNVSRLLHTTPEAFESARQQAILEGYKGIDQGRRVADIIEERRAQSPDGAQAARESERFAAESTFNHDPVGFAGVIYHALKYASEEGRLGGIPVLKPWLLFLRVPTNYFNAITNYTPMGAVRANFGQRGAGFKNPERRNFTSDERARMYLQSVIGTTVMGMFLAQSADNQQVDITAKGPSDPNKRRQLQQGGWIPYSFKIGNRRISYKDSPLLLPLAVAGHVADAMRYQKPKADMVLANQYTDALAKSAPVIFDTSMLTGLGQLMSAMKNGDMKGVGRTLGGIPANLLIPYNRLLMQIDQAFDDKVYDSNPLVSGVPFVRRTGTPQADVQGRPQTYDPSRRFGSTENADMVDSLLRDRNVFIPEVGRDTKLGNRTMTEPEHDAFRRISGQRIRIRLQAIAPRLRIMTREKAQDEIERIAREERDRVKPLIRGGVGVRK